MEFSDLFCGKEPKLEQMGRSGGASGRATAFCPSEPGSNPGGTPGLNLGFFVSDVVTLFSLGVGHFSYQ